MTWEGPTKIVFDSFPLWCSYDFAFVDAEKRMYQEYYELLLQLVIPE